MDILWQIITLKFVAPMYVYVLPLLLALVPALATFRLFHITLSSNYTSIAKRNAWRIITSGLFRWETGLYLLVFTGFLVFLAPFWAILSVIILDMVAAAGHLIIIFSKRY